MKLWSILGNSQKLDGGAMFGNAPRAMWERWTTVDGENRIDLACRALLASPLAPRAYLEAALSGKKYSDIRVIDGTRGPEGRPSILPTNANQLFDGQAVDLRELKTE